MWRRDLAKVGSGSLLEGLRVRRSSTSSSLDMPERSCLKEWGVIVMLLDSCGGLAEAVDFLPRESSDKVCEELLNIDGDGKDGSG